MAKVTKRESSEYNLGMYVRSLTALLRMVGPTWQIIEAVVFTQTNADGVLGPPRRMEVQQNVPHR